MGVSEKSCGYGGQMSLQTRNSGSAQGNRGWNRKYNKDDGDGLVIHSVGQLQVSPGRL